MWRSGWSSIDTKRKPHPLQQPNPYVALCSLPPYQEVIRKKERKKEKYKFFLKRSSIVGVVVIMK
jgi:hypothetical protein